MNVTNPQIFSYNLHFIPLCSRAARGERPAENAAQAQKSSAASPKRGQGEAFSIHWFRVAETGAGRYRASFALRIATRTAAATEPASTALSASQATKGATVASRDCQ